jgi:hypothetical protein
MHTYLSNEDVDGGLCEPRARVPPKVLLGRVHVRLAEHGDVLGRVALGAADDALRDIVVVLEVGHRSQLHDAEDAVHVHGLLDDGADAAAHTRTHKDTHGHRCKTTARQGRGHVLTGP